eukprot:TCONS_00028735-protein
MKRNETKKFPCTYPNCTWSFPTNYKLDRHIKSHTGEKAWICNFCAKSFANGYNLKEHSKLHTRLTAKQNNVVREETVETTTNIHFDCKDVSIPCPKKRCLRKFTTEKELAVHLTNHDLQYQCSFDGCHKRFSKPSILKQHEANHTQDRPFKCDFESCTKSFATKQKLKRHMGIHENKRNFSCPVEGCDKAFNCKEYLDSHLRTHQDTKPLKCPIEDCFKNFSCTSTLKVHLMKHANNRPFKCTHTGCEKTYLTASNLRSHEKVHKRKLLATSDDSDDSEAEETIDTNELMNLPAMDISIMSKEALVAAAFGEIACNEYMNIDSSQVPKDVDNTIDINVLNESDKEKLKDLQEEFVRNIYASSVNTDHSFLPSYLVPPGSSNKLNIESKEKPTMSTLDEPVTLEPSMELSTGHLEIDGACFQASSCMPDHIYSNKLYENSSTVNLQDIH